MVCQRKRRLVVLAAVFSLVYGVVFMATSALMLINNLTSKLLDMNLLTTLPLKELDAFLAGDNATIATIGYIAAFFIGLFALLNALKIMSYPIKEDGSVTYRGGRVFLSVIFSVVAIAMGLLGSNLLGLGDKLAEVGDLGLYAFVCYAYLGLGALSLIFAIIAAFQKTNVVRTKLVLDTKKNTFSPVVLGVEEKLKKIEQLKRVGAITEAQYNAAVIRLLNSI